MPSLRDDHDFHPEEPRLGSLTLAEIEADPPGSAVGQGRSQRRGQGQGQMPGQGRGGHSLKAEEEVKLGQALTALMRGKEPPPLSYPAAAGTASPGAGLPPDPGASSSIVSPVSWIQASEGPAGRARPDQPAWPATTRSGFGLRRLLDLLGMTLALLLIWSVYQGFAALPKAPSQSPWSLLGSARPDDHPANLTSAAKGTGKPLPPIGQFDFGQTTPATSQPVLAEREPVELYRSIYELEDSFEARYQPPPGCANLETNSSLDITDCINHRLNARRAFLSSNGRTMTLDKPDKGLKEGPIKNHWEAEAPDRRR